MSRVIGLSTEFALRRAEADIDRRSAKAAEVEVSQEAADAYSSEVKYFGHLTAFSDETVEVVYYCAKCTMDMELKEYEDGSKSINCNHCGDVHPIGEIDD